jgi:hypothetical protein
VKIRSEIIKKI